MPVTDNTKFRIYSQIEEVLNLLVKRDLPNNRAVKRKSKSFQSKQKRIRVLESDSDIEFLPSGGKFRR